MQTRASTIRCALPEDGVGWVVGSCAFRQMIIHVPFVQSVRLKAILLKLGG
jgi:hypothetical protein